MRWTLDPSRSTIEFALRHFGVATVTGRFRTFSGSVRGDDRVHPLKGLEADISADSAETEWRGRDVHVPIARVFGSQEHPVLSYRSTWARPMAHGRFQIEGLLTMNGETHNMEFIAERGEMTSDEAGRAVYRAAAEGALDRRLWSGQHPAPLAEIGGLVLGHEVHFRLRLVAVSADAGGLAAHGVNGG